MTGDVESLTLPKPTSRTRRRIRRPRRPSGWQLYWGCYCIWCATFVVVDSLGSHLAGALFQCAFLGAGWICLTNRHRAMPWPTFATALGVGLAAYGMQLTGAIT